MNSLNGYNSANRPFQNDKWTPILDTFNEWMELGDYRFGQLHCPFYGCPLWGLNLEYHAFKVEIGFVCLGFWNPTLTSCLSCMTTCFSFRDSRSCNQLCSD